jgi:hypothetical protein
MAVIINSSSLIMISTKICHHPILQINIQVVHSSSHNLPGTILDPGRLGIIPAIMYSTQIRSTKVCLCLQTKAIRMEDGYQVCQRYFRKRPILIMYMALQSEVNANVYIPIYLFIFQYGRTRALRVAIIFQT